jgi:hypothetical protein
MHRIASCLVLVVVLLLGGRAATVFAQSCGSASDCDDGIPCTVDRCVGNMAGEQSCENVVDETICDDGDSCTTDTCTATGCMHSGTPCPDCGNDTDCDDGNPCTRDRCVGNMSGDHSCENVLDETVCDDGDSCTTDTCTPTGCMHSGTPCPECGNDTDCDDGNPCTRDRCVGNMGGDHSCENVLDETMCDDGDSCTTDTCTPTGCMHSGTPCPECGNDSDCDDGNPCTRDRCVGNMGGDHSCDNIFDSTACDDGDACTTDTCTQAGCQYAPVSCDDGDGCTIDSCAAGACGHAPVDCDDMDLCTVDACTGGGCTHTPVSCDDGDACTLDSCTNGVCGCDVDPTCAAQGCTPGYWKTNAQKRGANAWASAYTPGTKIRDVFALPSCLGGAIGNATLLQGLGFTGGTTLDAVARNLLRAAVAAVLNASSHCVQYGLCTDSVVGQTNTALASCAKAPMKVLAARLDAANALTCPLDQRGTCRNP